MNIYDEIGKKFQNETAYVILKDGKPFAKINAKYPVKGEGRLNLYFHIHGIEAAKGVAIGAGYDKFSAALYNAAKNIDAKEEDYPNSKTYKDTSKLVEAFRGELDGCWDRRAEDAGFQVISCMIA